MGLDLVEIIVEVESRFGIDIPEKDSYDLTTPRKLMDYVAEKVQLADSTTKPCATQIAFYKIRKTLVTQFGESKKRITPSLPIQKLLPTNNPNKYLKELLISLKTDNGPYLTFTENFERFVTYPALFAFLVAFVWLTAEVGTTQGIMGGLLVSVLPASIIFKLFEHKKTQLIPRDYTVGDLAKVIISDKLEQKVSSTRTWTKNQINQEVQAIIMRILGIGSFEDNADFIDDLGAG